jgi:hypothetical protein
MKYTARSTSRGPANGDNATTNGTELTATRDPAAVEARPPHPSTHGVTRTPSDGPHGPRSAPSPKSGTGHVP